MVISAELILAQKAKKLIELNLIYFRGLFCPQQVLQTKISLKEYQKRC